MVQKQAYRAFLGNMESTNPNFCSQYRILDFFKISTKKFGLFLQTFIVVQSYWNAQEVFIGIIKKILVYIQFNYTCYNED